MKYSKVKNQSTFSWLAYGALSISMLAIAVVSATQGQDKGADSTIQPAVKGASRTSGLNQEKTQALHAKLVLPLYPRWMSRAGRRPDRFQYAVKLHQAANKGAEENLLRFEVTRTPGNFGGMMGGGMETGMGIQMEANQDGTGQKESKKPAPQKTAQPVVVATGVFQVDTSAIYIETPSKNGLVVLRSLNREHLAAIKALENRETETQLANSDDQETKR